MAETAASSTRARMIPDGGGKDAWDIAAQYAAQLAQSTRGRESEEAKAIMQAYGERSKDARQVSQQTHQAEQADTRYRQQTERDATRFGQQTERDAVQEGYRREREAGKLGPAPKSSPDTAVFMSTLASGGLGNPYALAAVRAHVQAESAGSSRAFNANDVNGPSGGLLQWHDVGRRGGRLSDLSNYALSRGTDWRGNAKVQADFMLQEYQSKYPRQWAQLSGAKSVEEAHDAMRQIQRYAGYDQVDGAENTKRLGLARSYAGRGGEDLGTSSPTGRGRIQQAPATAEAALVDESGRQYKHEYINPKQAELLRKPPDLGGIGAEAFDKQFVKDVGASPNKNGWFPYRRYSETPTGDAATPPPVERNAPLVPDINPSAPAPKKQHFVIGSSIGDAIRQGGVLGNTMKSRNSAEIRKQIAFTEKANPGFLKQLDGLTITSGAENDFGSDLGNVAGSLTDLKGLGVDLSRVRVVGVGNDPRYPKSLNNTLRGMAEKHGAQFVDLGETDDGVHPKNGKGLWNRIAATYEGAGTTQVPAQQLAATTVDPYAQGSEDEDEDDN